MEVDGGMLNGTDSSPIRSTVIANCRPRVCHMGCTLLDPDDISTLGILVLDNCCDRGLLSEEAVLRDLVGLTLKEAEVMSGKVTPVLGENHPLDVSSPEDGDAGRDKWGSKLEFILTCVGYAVGLGNVWRFPYLTYQNGGGAFLIPYLLMMILVGFPVFFFELCFGQFCSLGPISCWTISPLFKGVGVAMVATNWCVGLYYCVIVAWSFYFFFASFTDKLPWSECGNDWNSLQCITGPERKNLSGLNETELEEALITGWNTTKLVNLKAPSEEYFYKKVLQMSGSIDEPGHVVWELALCLLLTYIIVFLVLLKGIKSLGKVIYFASLFPYFMLTILVIRGATLPGSDKGVEYFLSPDTQKLADPVVWSDAATMTFYSLSACTGGLIAMSSYNNFNNNCLRDSLIVPIVTALTSVYSGFAIFTVLGFMADQKGVNVTEVATQGPGLTFVVYPEALTRMPVPPLWSVLFFVMLLSLGFSSLFSIVESVFVAVMDEFPEFLRCNPRRPIIFRGVMITIYFLISLPMVSQNGFYLFSLTDSFVSGFPFLFIGLIELIAIFTFYGYNWFADDIALMLGKRPIVFFKVTWVVVTPLLLALCIIAKCVVYEDFSLSDNPDAYPPWGQVLGWLQVAFCLSWIPVVAIFEIIRSGSIKNTFHLTQFTKKWGPALLADRIGTKYDPNFNQKAAAESPEHSKKNVATISGETPEKTSELVQEKSTLGHQYDNPEFNYKF